MMQAITRRPLTCILAKGPTLSEYRLVIHYEDNEPELKEKAWPLGKKIDFFI
jgi:hypothetical protein